MSDDLARLLTRVRRVRTQIGSFRELHSQELQMILDELSDIAAAADAPAAPTSDVHVDAAPATTTMADPAAASPKRAKWLAEQERKAHLSRRDLFRPRSE